MEHGSNGTERRKTGEKKAEKNNKNNPRKKSVESREPTGFTALTKSLIKVPCFGDKLREIICFLATVKADTIHYLPQTEIICSAVPRGAI
jgi:hypothetical protein